MASWNEEIAALTREALSAVAAAPDVAALEEVRVRFLGKKGKLSTFLRSMGSLPAGDRPEAGRVANEAREQLEQAWRARHAAVTEAAEAERLANERVDVTLPGRRPSWGHEHPLYQVQRQVEAIFRGLGFEIATGPEVELDTYNFELLNIPADHPAREMQDSFYLTPSVLLRTQTSPVQIRFMQARAPRLPVRMIAPGRVYRRDDDATHSPMFHQVEGLLVDRHVTLGHLKGTLDAFARQVYGADVKTRLRPSYFPFTEPSVEMDVSCPFCAGEGCRTCKGGGWIEILGAGMVHPRVLRNGGYDPGQVSGFAFGMGLERIAMLRFGIDDLRRFFENDMRFLEQF